MGADTVFRGKVSDTKCLSPFSLDVTHKVDCPLKDKTPFVKDIKEPANVFSL